MGWEWLLLVGLLEAITELPYHCKGMIREASIRMTKHG